MSDDEQLPSSKIEDAINEALRQPVPRATWWQRLLARVRSLPSWLTRNGGYWGGVIMVLRRAGSSAAAFLRRR